MLSRTLVKPSARSLTGQPAAPVPSIKRCERRRGQLSICAGILDSYRQQLGGNGTTTLLSVREEVGRPHTKGGPGGSCSSTQAVVDASNSAHVLCLLASWLLQTP